MSPDLSSTALQFAFICPLSAGMHARPASHLAKLANTLVSECTLTNLRNHREGNAKSVLSIISLDIREGDRCLIQINGSDEQFGYTTLRDFAEQFLPACDVPLAKSPPPSSSLPRILQQAGVKCYSGSAASPGVGRGKVVFLNSVSLPQSAISENRSDPQEELERLQRALRKIRDNIREELAGSTSPAGQDVLQAELALVDDVLFAQKLGEHIHEGKSAAQSVLETGKFFSDLLHHSDSEYIRERAADIEEISAQLLAETSGETQPRAATVLAEPSVVVAETLAPRQFLALDRRFLRGIVLEYAGANSHALILARSYGVPAVVGIKHTKSLLSTGQEILLDANRGLLFPEWSRDVERFYAREERTQLRQKAVLQAGASSPAITRDRITLEVGANASTHDEVFLAFQKGADGIGLFRTEILFLNGGPPSEDEQLAVYQQVVKSAKGKPLIIRTFDLGGDKAAPYLELPGEENPFLGVRGVRLYREHRDLLQVQLRAILRASASGKVQIMIPMVSCLEDVLSFKEHLQQAKDGLRAQNLAFSEDVSVGIMLEVPAAAFNLDQFGGEVDFFSIGTNDLAQYFFAADRGNPNVSRLSNPSNPSFIRFLHQIIEKIRAAGKWVGVCGDMASHAKYVPLFLGLGLDEISLPIENIPKIKEAVRRLSASACRSLVDQILLSQDAADVNDLLASAEQTCSSSPLVSEELMILDSDSSSKEEVMQEFVDLLYNSGRTSDPQELAEALWARESVYSTGLGFAFATPHCKTDAINASSIVVVKLSEPIEWGSVDGVGVRMVIGIAMRATQNGDHHMQVFSVLARKLMIEDFRTRLLETPNSPELMQYLTRELKLTLT